MLSPSRKSRQRKPSHFGSYCQFAPSGIVPTDRASIGAKGGLSGRVMRRANAAGALGFTCSPHGESAKRLRHPEVLACISPRASKGSLALGYSEAIRGPALRAAQLRATTKTQMAGATP